MVVVYSPQSTARLHYVCDFIFCEQLGIPYVIINDKASIPTHSDAFINYSEEEFSIANFKIHPHGLLFERDIRIQSVIISKAQEGLLYFFQTNHDDLGFDIFSAIFYLLSRYEEYLPHKKDIYGRYAHENSLAFQHNFLHLPLVNIWLQEFEKKLKTQYTSLQVQRPPFEYTITYDIDMAWSYSHKGFWRNLAGFIKSPTWARWQVWLGKQKDPFDVYDEMDELHRQYQIQPLYFFLIADRLGQFDKNISVQKKAMKRLIEQCAASYPVGLHPSWRSNHHSELVQSELNELSELAGKTIECSRQHYVKWTLPHTFRQLIYIGIQKDYSMGYGSINGFRASVASSFLWYDLEKESKTTLRLYPFCFMDANCHYEQNLSPVSSRSEFFHYFHISKQYGSLFVPIFHNHFLGSEKEFGGWNQIWREALSAK